MTPRIERKIVPDYQRSFVCKGCGQRAGYIRKGEQQAAVHVRPSCSLYKEMDGPAYVAMHQDARRLPDPDAIITKPRERQ